MADDFDPDAYLAQPAEAPKPQQVATNTGFDPDAYLASKQTPAPPPAKATNTSNSFDPDAYLAGKPQPQPASDKPMPGYMESIGLGLKRAATSVGETLGSEAQEPSEAEKQVQQPYELRDLYELSRGVKKGLYQVSGSAPTLAGGVAGMAAGTATAGPVGAVLGGAGGAALGTGVSTIGPVFHEELKKTPDDPDGAYNRALEHAGVSGAFSALGWGLFPVKFFQGPLKNAVFQTFGVQAPISAAEKGVQNVLDEKPITEGLGQAYTQGAVNTAVPAIGHALVSGTIKGRNPVDPDPRTPDQIKAADEATTQQQEATSLREQADRPETSSEDEFRLKQQAGELDDQATQSQFEANRPNIQPPERSGIAKSWVDNFQPELFSDKALQTDPLFARFKSSTAQIKDAIIARADEMYYRWNKVPMEDRLRFLDAYEHDDPLAMADLNQRYPWMAERAEAYREWLRNSYMQEKDYGSRADYLQNYFPHIWENPSQALQVIQRIFATDLNPQTAGQGYQKARFYDDIKAGMEAGLKLKYQNPEDMVSSRLLAGADMQQKTKLLQDLYREGVAVPVEKAPADIANPGRDAPYPWKEVTGPNRSRWLLAPDVQALWKNAVDAKGLWANEGAVGNVFRGWMSLKNAWVPIKLGLSLFHPIHVQHINLSNNIARALNETFGRGQQGIGARLTAIPKAIGQSAYDTGMLFDAVLARPLLGAAGLRSLPHVGKEIGEAWLTHPDVQSPRQKQLTQMMNEAGSSAQLSEQLRIAAKRNLSDAWNSNNYLKMLSPLVRRSIEGLQKPIFEQWIPQLKSAAIARETEALFRRDPSLMNDPQRRLVAMRAIGKQVDNRFGEMFYGNLFWNRTVKDAAIGSFLSLGWNLGFAREFVGGALEPAARKLMDAPSPTRKLIRDVTSKSTNAFVYAFTAMTFNAILQKSMTGQGPAEWLDYVFPKIGGTNPDGSPRRISNPFYTREVPMAQKHIEERQGVVSGLADMLHNKLMFQPFVDMGTNRNYYGSNIWDENAPLWKQWQQFGSYVLNDQLNPISISGAKRALQLSGKPHDFKDVVQNVTDKDVWMPMLGFGPAPSYASKDPVQNRIDFLYRRYIAPEERPYEEGKSLEKRGELYTSFKQALQSKDPARIQDAARALAENGVSSKTLKSVASNNVSQYHFQRLGSVPSQQIDLLKRMTPEQFKTYFPYAAKKVQANPEIISIAKQVYHFRSPQ